jgi:hypothetical protein
MTWENTNFNKNKKPKNVENVKIYEYIKNQLPSVGLWKSDS